MSSTESFIAISPAHNCIQRSGKLLSLSPWFPALPTPATQVPITVPMQHNGKQNLKQLNDIGLQAFTMMHNERNGSVQFRAWSVYLGL